METSNLPPPQALSAPPQPVMPRLAPRLPVEASPIAGVSTEQWQAVRLQAAHFHHAQQQAAQFHAARQQITQWGVPLHSAPPPGPSRSHRRRAGLIAGVVIVGMIAGAAAMVLLRADKAEATYSLDAATMQANRTNTVTLEYQTSTPDGMTAAAEVEMDIERGLTSVVIDDGFSDDWRYIFDLEKNRMYLDADSYEELGLDVGDAEWIQFDLDDLTDVDASEMYAQFGENPLDASAMFENADAVEDLGFDVVRGDRVKHYEVTIDEELAFGTEMSADASSDIQTNGFVNDGSADPEGKVVFDVYVNESNQMVRMAYTLDIMGEYVSFDVTVTGINEEVDIDLPRRADVIDADQLEDWDS
jgi:hypothetical protein